MKKQLIFFFSKTRIGRMILFLFSETFDKEFKESLYSKYIFHKQKKTSKNIFLLRRNIHRIEKGLCAEKRRPVFALGFIKPTIVNYCSLVSDK